MEAPVIVRSALAAALTAALAPAGSAGQAGGSDLDPTGLWLIESGNAVIRIDECGERICGAIFWLAEGGPVLDEENPDPELRDRPLCGLRILEGFAPNPDERGEWTGGEVYAADEGETYRGRIRVEGPDRLDLRGYVGIPLFGRSQTWVRVSEEEYAECEPPASPAALRLTWGAAGASPGSPRGNRRTAPAG